MPFAELRTTNFRRAALQGLLQGLVCEINRAEIEPKRYSERTLQQDLILRNGFACCIEVQTHSVLQDHMLAVLVGILLRKIPTPAAVLTWLLLVVCARPRAAERGE